MFCKYLDCAVTKPCKVKSCQFNINNEFSKNCLLFHASKTGDVTLTELAGFYNKTYSEVKKVYTSAIGKTRDLIVPQLLTTMSVTYIDTDKVCVACESTFDGEPEHTLKTGHVICSEDCLEEFPAAIWDLSIKYEALPLDLIKTIFNYFKTNRSIMSFLNLKNSQVNHLRSLAGGVN